MRTLRAQWAAVSLTAALVIGLAIPAAAQDAAADAKMAAEAKAAAESKSAAAADTKIAAENKATAEAKAASGTSPSPGASPQRRGVRAGDVQKVLVLKHVRVDDMARVLSVFPAEFSGMERANMHVLSVSAAPAVVAPDRGEQSVATERASQPLHALRRSR